VKRDSKQKRWASSAPDLYPEIGFERTLGKIILEIIALSGREITLSDESTEVFAASLRKSRRICKLWTGAGERIFISHFSMRGVQMAYHLTSDLREVAQAVESWLMDELTLREMKQRIPNLNVSEIAFEIEAGRGVAAHWNHLLLSLDGYSEANQAYWFEPEFCALVRAAANRPLLRQLVPKVSLGCILLFSRTLGYPYVIAGNCGIFAARGQCIVQTKDGKQLAEGRLEDMLDVFERTLTQDTGPAIFGTAEDLIA
jgi:uncharacterized protein DUF6193